MRHGIPPAEDGRGNPLPGIEPQRVDEVAAGQPAAASGRPGGGRCRSVEDADSGHGRSCERKEGHGPERSEEHTSELQSLMRISYAVFCLKKKNISSKE